MVGAPDVNNGAGGVYVFRRTGTRWHLCAVLTDPQNRPGDDFGWSVAVDGDTALIGAPSTTYFSSGPPGAVYVYVGSGARWRLRARISAPHPSSGDSFGTTVAMAGKQALIGESGYSKVSDAYVYQHSGSHWKLQASLPDPGHAAGTDVPAVTAFSSSLAVLGAPGVDGGSGAVYVYRRMEATWRRSAVLADPGDLGDDFFGSGLALHGPTLMVGSWGAGAVYVYAESGASWQLTSTIHNSIHVGNYGQAVATNGKVAVFSSLDATAVYVLETSGWELSAMLSTPDGRYGPALALGRTTLIAGATPGPDNDVGAGFVYTEQGGRWRRQAVLSDPRGRASAYKGSAVAISGGTAVAGAWGKYDRDGIAFIYARERGRWRQQVTVRDPGHNYFGMFGIAVAASGSTVAIGAPQAGDSDGGQVLLYVRRHGRWDLRARINDPGNYLEDAFGSSVAMAGSTMVVAAQGAGVAYIFAKVGQGWRQQAVLSDPGGGATAAVSDGTVVIGAAGTHDDAGVAYVYARSGDKWHLQSTLTDPRGVPNDEFGTSVAVSGGTVVVGAPGVRNFRGAAYTYARSGPRWLREGTLTITRSADVAGGFGGSVAMTGTGTRTLAIVSGLAVSGLAPAGHLCGKAFEFSRATGKWREAARLADPRCTPYDEFGYALAMSPSTAIIGAPGTDGDTGTAWIRDLREPKPS